jgi:hypothetical protein
VIFICNTIHHIENRAQYYAVLREVLAPGGRIVVVDFRKDAKLEEGPPEAMRLDRKDLEKELSQAGFRVSEEHDFLPDQYFVVFSE